MKRDGAVHIMHGNEACVEGALLAGCRFFAGYPITPASEVAEIMAAKMPQKRGVFLQMEDELASVNALIGAAWGGMKPMTATSGPGFSLMQEGIGYAVVSRNAVCYFKCDAWWSEYRTTHFFCAAGCLPGPVWIPWRL
jgi:pyruvate/2-oxoacid:ferredoxin oxidoreductase alpha subunit